MSTSLSARRRLFAVFIGGFCGTITRYLLSMLIQGWLGKSWPYDILFRQGSNKLDTFLLTRGKHCQARLPLFEPCLINITGAFILALVTTLADATVLVGPTRRLFINVGFLGAYTTFSSLAFGDVLLLTRSQWLLALLYLVLSMLGGVVAVLLGDWLGQWCIHKVRRPGLPVHSVQKASAVQEIDVLLPDHRDGVEAKRPRL